MKNLKWKLEMLLGQLSEISLSWSTKSTKITKINTEINIIKAKFILFFLQKQKKN